MKKKTLSHIISIKNVKSDIENELFSKKYKFEKKCFINKN